MKIRIFPRIMRYMKIPKTITQNNHETHVMPPKIMTYMEIPITFTKRYMEIPKIIMRDTWQQALETHRNSQRTMILSQTMS